MLDTILAIALGGAIGGIARHLLGQAVQTLSRGEFPWGTLCVNFSGSLGIGLVAATLLPGATEQPDSLLALFVLTGFFGSFTTVSTFSLQTLTLFRAGHNRMATINVIASTGLCLAGVTLGMLAAT